MTAVMLDPKLLLMCQRRVRVEGGLALKQLLGDERPEEAVALEEVAGLAEEAPVVGNDQQRG